MADDNVEDVRQKIHRMHQRIQDASYYQLLDIDRDGPIDDRAVMEHFRQKARHWHADRYSGFDLDGSDRRKLQEIFSALNTAQQTLSDPDRRAEYDFKLEAGDQNIEHVIDAEDAFRRGKNMLKTGSYKGAHRQFEQAYQLNPDERDYRAHLLYTKYLQIPKDDDGAPVEQSPARDIKQELDEINQQKPNDDATLTFLGVVTMGLGNSTKAKSLFNQALQHNRQNVVAQRQLRLINMRQNRAEDRGFLDKLLDKFRS